MRLAPWKEFMRHMIVSEQNRRAADLASVVEGCFKQSDVDGIYDGVIAEVQEVLDELKNQKEA